MKRNVCFMVLLVYCSNMSLTRAQLPKVCLQGTTCALGRLMRGYETYLYEAFLGIPYAKPPTGELRFSNPEDVKLWKGTLTTQYPKPDCIQKNYINALAPVTGSEDCLYLNVYRPLNRPAQKLPVLFYIHGGGFFSGSPSPFNEGPEYFMDTGDVIVVVPAYRLGLFGFLSTDDQEMTGNFGLKDQNLALKWVNKHIAAFGGDPTRVTLFGHSAGAASVHYHLLSDASKALFNNAILMSGVANAPYAQPLADPKAQVVELAKAAGITEAEYLTTEGLVVALRKINPITLLAAADKLKSWNVYPLPTFHPNIEDPSWPEAFLTADPSTLTISKPWIVGNVPSKGEGVGLALRLASNPILWSQFNKDFDNLLSTMLVIPSTVEKTVTDSIISEYMDGEHELNADTLDGFLKLLGDAFFIYPTYKTIETNLNTLKGIIKFDYRGPYSYSSVYTSSYTNFSTAHGDDSLFLFTAPRTFPWGYWITSPEAALAKRYVELYAEFAKTGSTSNFETCTSLTGDNCKYLSIVKNTELFQTGSTWDYTRLQMWDSVYNKENIDNITPSIIE